MNVRFYLGMLLFFNVLQSPYLQSQVRKCGTEERHQFYASTVHDYLEVRKDIEEKIRHSSQDKAGVSLLIPVVVHIIHRLPAQNITDQQVASQIDILNKDFNKLNWDTMKVPSVWKNIIANCSISFVLANRDPLGQVTNGITRTQTTTPDIASFTGDDHCFTSKGGHDIWNRNEYLNIWVCEISDNLYGFSTMPGSPAASDGVVISFEAFGTTGTATAPTNLGRTATHEIGHWFNLYHPWGTPTCGNDFVADTPPQDDANFDCEVYPKISCSNGPHGDMFMNFMDYSDDNCLNMFTMGQDSRMHAAINTARSTLLTSSGYNSITVTEDIQFKIGPNPAMQEIEITSTLNQNIGSITLIDLHGREVVSLENTGRFNSLSIPVTNIENGIYILLISSDQLEVRRRIVVSH